MKIIIKNSLTSSKLRNGTKIKFDVYKPNHINKLLKVRLDCSNMDVSSHLFVYPVGSY